MDIPFHSDEAKKVNVNIFETIYHAALECSMEIARERKSFMKALKMGYINKEWAFENSIPSCNTYLTKNGIDYIDDIEKYNPIYNEFKLLNDNH